MEWVAARSWRRVWAVWVACGVALGACGEEPATVYVGRRDGGADESGGAGGSEPPEVDAGGWDMASCEGAASALDPDRVYVLSHRNGEPVVRAVEDEDEYVFGWPKDPAPGSPMGIDSAGLIAYRRGQRGYRFRAATASWDDSPGRCVVEEVADGQLDAPICYGSDIIDFFPLAGGTEFAYRCLMDEAGDNFFIGTEGVNPLGGLVVGTGANRTLLLQDRTTNELSISSASGFLPNPIGGLPYDETSNVMGLVVAMRAGGNGVWLALSQDGQVRLLQVAASGSVDVLGAYPDAPDGQEVSLAASGRVIHTAVLDAEQSLWQINRDRDAIVRRSLDGTSQVFDALPLDDQAKLVTGP